MGISGLMMARSIDINFFRDLLFFSLPIVNFSLGGLISKKGYKFQKINQVVILSVSIVSVIMLYSLILSKEGSQGLFEINNLSLFLIGDILVYCVFILINKNNNEKYTPYNYHWSIQYLNYLTLILSLSRTYFITLFVYIFINFKFFNKKNVKIISSIFLLLIIFIVFAKYNLFKNSDDNINIITKILNSFGEIKVINYESLEDINNNWRGYESFLAWRYFSEGSILNIMFGKGYGTRIPLDFTMQIGENFYDDIPNLHNGYLYVIIKTGLIGIASLMIFLIMNIYHSIKYINYSSNNIYARLLLSISIIFFIQNYVVGGFVEGGSIMLTIIMGFCFEEMKKDQS